MAKPEKGRTKVDPPSSSHLHTYVPTHFEYTNTTSFRYNCRLENIFTVTLNGKVR